MGKAIMARELETTMYSAIIHGIFRVLGGSSVSLMCAELLARNLLKNQCEYTIRMAP